jgi:hypothetical protein
MLKKMKINFFLYIHILCDMLKYLENINFIFDLALRSDEPISKDFPLTNDRVFDLILIEVS